MHWEHGVSDAEKQITKLLCGDTGFLVEKWEVSGRWNMLL